VYASRAPYLGFFQNLCNIYSLRNLDESTTLRAALRRRHVLIIKVPSAFFATTA
jgi:hypothetical protein